MGNSEVLLSYDGHCQICTPGTSFLLGLDMEDVGTHLSPLSPVPQEEAKAWEANPSSCWCRALH
jgi:predicted DCC family thiol-disulfide oxidoreductase YuxK